jgi:CDGSH-type Zn-finger protein
MEKENPKIKVTKNGPYLIFGNLPLQKEVAATDENGDPEKWLKGEKYPGSESCALCRCGKSKNKPYCDGSHIKEGFDGTEKADNEKYAKQAEIIKGPNLDLADAQNFCSSGRFCHRAGGTWNLTENSDDPASKEMAIREACNCPSGRLVAINKKTGKPIESDFKPSVSFIEDPGAGVSGPIWVKGGVQIESADAKKYEIRNRVTLCRCGKSKNKPFCDGSHIDEKFNDGDNSLK